MKRWPGLAAVLCSVAALGVAGCGGGGGGGSPDSTGQLTSSGGPGSSTAGTASADGASPGATTTAGTSGISPEFGGPASPATAADAAIAPVATAGSAPRLGDCELFPSNAIFNTRIDDVSRFPRHSNSDRWVALVGHDVPFGPDWGVSENAADPSTYWGQPFNVIDSSASDWPVVSFDFSTSGVFMDRGYPDKSDCAVADGRGGYSIGRPCGQVPTNQRRFPFPRSNIQMEAGQCNDPNRCGDRHILVVEKGACRLWESYFSYNLSGQWYVMATAAWDLKSLAMRPNDWASSNAAGLPLVPLLAKAAEAATGEIKHALSVGFTDSKLAIEVAWPGRFAAGGDNPGAIPFGSLLRLKADFVIPDHWTTQAKAVATAAKRYGIYVSDNGGEFHVRGDPSSQWNPQAWHDLRNISMSDMEFVDLGTITRDPRFSPDSMQASW